MADQHDDVRAWLADDPAPKMPDDVAARMHAAIDRESQARQDESGPVAASAPATVTPLRRRGRWKAPLLAAAGVVAVVAIGVPVIQQMSDTDSGDDAGSATGDSFSSATTGEDRAPAGESPEDAEGDSAQAAPTAQLHRESFAADVRAYVDPRDLQTYRTSSSAVSDVGCRNRVPAGGSGLDATLDGDPAVLLVAPRGDEASFVRAVICENGGPRVAARAVVR